MMGSSAAGSGTSPRPALRSARRYIHPGVADKLVINLKPNDTPGASEVRHCREIGLGAVLGHPYSPVPRCGSWWYLTLSAQFLVGFLKFFFFLASFRGMPLVFLL
jgi:hypothetical protein